MVRGNHVERMVCVDAGSEHCPCLLASTGDCLICSRLQGKDVCDCQWDGVCPYGVFVQNGGRVADIRRDVPITVLERKDYSNDVTVLVLDVGRGFAQRASLPGSFVFLHRSREGSGVYFDTPISVLRADEAAGTIHLAIRREGPKSKSLLDDASQYLVRGVYRSGLQKVEYLKPAYVKGKSVLFLTKGIGAAPAMLAMQYLRPLTSEFEGTKIRWLADDAKIDRALLVEYGAVRPEYVVLNEEWREARLLENIHEERYDVVVIAASEYYVDRLSQAVQEILPEANLVIANNAKMCCGEGICGACTEIAEDGTVIRRCKCRG